MHVGRAWPATPRRSYARRPSQDGRLAEARPPLSGGGATQSRLPQRRPHQFITPNGGHECGAKRCREEGGIYPPGHDSGST